MRFLKLDNPWDLPVGEYCLLLGLCFMALGLSIMALVQILRGAI